MDQYSETDLLPNARLSVSPSLYVSHPSPSIYLKTSNCKERTRNKAIFLPFLYHIPLISFLPLLSSLILPPPRRPPPPFVNHLSVSEGGVSEQRDNGVCTQCQ